METEFLTDKEREKFYDYLFSRDWTIIAAGEDGQFLKRANRVFFMDRGSVVFDGDFNGLKGSDYAEFIR